MNVGSTAKLVLYATAEPQKSTCNELDGFETETLIRR